jgi:hypothetical protein
MSYVDSEQSQAFQHFCTDIDRREPKNIGKMNERNWSREGKVSEKLRRKNENKLRIRKEKKIKEINITRQNDFERKFH